MQLEFRFYKVGPGERPAVQWLAHFPLPSPDVKEVLAAAGFNPTAPDLYSFGHLAEVWGAHQQGCLFITRDRKLPDGEPFAVSLKPL